VPHAVCGFLKIYQSDNSILVATADDEVVDAVVGVSFEDMPQIGFATDLDHRLEMGRGVFGNTRAKPPCKNNDLHFLQCPRWFGLIES